MDFIVTWRVILSENTFISYKKEKITYDDQQYSLEWIIRLKNL